jgi:hypothetical protein
MTGKYTFSCAFARIVKGKALEMPSPGAGLATVTSTFPAAVRADAITGALNCVLLI